MHIYIGSWTLKLKCTQNGICGQAASENPRAMLLLKTNGWAAVFGWVQKISVFFWGGCMFMNIYHHRPAPGDFWQTKHWPVTRLHWNDNFKHPDFIYSTLEAFTWKFTSVLEAYFPSEAKHANLCQLIWWYIVQTTWYNLWFNRLSFEGYCFDPVPGIGNEGSNNLKMDCISYTLHIMGNAMEPFLYFHILQHSNAM